jgi:3'(2'), 5'-bisphosphate nucleotidase
MMTTLPPGWRSAEAEFLLRALEAATAILGDARHARTKTTKADWTPVTAADLAVQAALAGLLEETFPSDVLVAEESSAVLGARNAARLSASTLAATRLIHPTADLERITRWLDRGRGEPGRRFWVLDPVDGTRGLIGSGQYAAVMGLVEDDVVVLGGMVCPRYAVGAPVGSVALARRGEGAWAAPCAGGAWSRLAVSGEADPKKCRLLRSVFSGWQTSARLRALRRALGTKAPEVRMDSQVKYLALAGAAGELIVRLPRPQPENIWDHACGVLLVEEAGGRCSDTEGRPLDFHSARQMDTNRGVVASNARLHEAALEALRRTEPESP